MLNWFDIVILVFLLIAFINGYRKGLVTMLVGLATVILAAVFGGKLAARILPELQNLFDMSPQVANVLSYVAAFFLIAIVVSLAGKMVQKICESVNLSFVNRLLGSVISLATAMVVCSILLNLVLMLDFNEKLIKPEVKKESFFYDRVRVVVPAIVPYLDKEIWEEYVPEKYRKQIEGSGNTNDISGNGQTIDSTFQKKHFDTDSI